MTATRTTTQSNRPSHGAEALTSSRFWKAALITYVACVGGAWGLVEASSFFVGDTLKEAFGPFWIARILHLSPLPCWSG